MVGYTKGPWVNEIKDGIIFIGPYDSVYKGVAAIVATIEHHPAREPNATLIAAAPDLLEACRLLIGADGEGMMFSDRVNKASHAIAKAEGK